MADLTAMNVGKARRENCQGTFFGRKAILLPEKFSATARNGVAVENPGQHPADRFGGFVAGVPVAVPGSEALAWPIVLQIEQGVDE